ncbi:MAG TPA: hypothetical protein VJS66_05130, partial [Burkholderiales bacterium]|nr:hypothetical protein [Burkholderiales bacterium]
MMLLSHPTGNQNVRNAALAFHRSGLLERFYTTVVWRDSGLARLLPGSVLATLRRRRYEMLPDERVSTYPVLEACRLLAVGLKLNALTRHETGPCCVDAVYRTLDAHVARELRGMTSVSGVYTYEDGALQTLRAAKQKGMRTTYEVASAHWRAAARIFKEEAELNPEWATTIAALRDSPEKLERKDEEIRLADQVVVASKFTASSLGLGEFDDKK